MNKPRIIGASNSHKEQPSMQGGRLYWVWSNQNNPITVEWSGVGDFTNWEVGETDYFDFGVEK